MNTLLAKEMVNETSGSGKRRSPSIVAKLMGLDALPSPQPIHQKRSEFSDNSHKITARRIDKPFRHDQLDKKTTIEQQYFKDVYEDPQVTAERRSTKLELEYIKERCDEMIRESIAIKTKLERVDSSPDLMLSFMNDRQDVPFASCFNEIIVLKPSNASRYGSSGKVLKESVNCRVPVSHQRNKNGHLGCFCHSNNNCRRSSRNRLERKDATGISPTEIVVLKSNVANIYSDKRFLHSADKCWKDAELDFYGGEVRCSRHRSREAREIARRITSRMKDGFESEHVHKFDSCESEMMAISSQDSFRQSTRPRCAHSNMSESVVIKEAKKRMSQRWETNEYKDVGIVGKSSSTLEDMLSVPNNETRAHSRTGYSMGPYGISDGYGWSDGYQRSTSRSKSLPLPRNQSKKVGDYHEADADEKIMVHEKPVHRDKSKGVKGYISDIQDSRSRRLQYSERCHTSHYWNAYSPEFDNILPSGTYFENKVPAEQESLISDIHDVTANAASVIDVCMLGDAISSAVDEDSLNSQEPATANFQGTVSMQLSGPKPESCKGSKEFDQHGQISVPEVPPTEDLSSGSDSFERVSSKLHELRKQLHWLKMESGTTYDSPNDEDREQRSSSCTVSESETLESTYLTDLLQHSEFHDHDPYTFITKWYSIDRPLPIYPRLSDHLEKKHSQVSRPERRLFHDRLNEAVFLLSKTMVSWSFGQRGTWMTLTETGFKDQLQKLLDKQEKEANREFEDMSIDNDLDWFKPVNETVFVGKQIAEVLVNELVLEIVRVG